MAMVGNRFGAKHPGERLKAHHGGGVIHGDVDRHVELLAGGERFLRLELNAVQAEIPRNAPRVVPDPNRERELVTGNIAAIIGHGSIAFDEDGIDPTGQRCHLEGAPCPIITKFRDDGGSRILELVERGRLEHLRAERLIAIGRILLVIFALMVIYIDPEVTEVREGRAFSMALLFGGYSLILFVAAWRIPLRVAEFRLLIHAVDFTIFGVAIHFTNASVTPFFVFFLFSVLSGLLRFGVKGMTLTAVTAIVAYVVLAAADDTTPSQPGYLIMRVTTLAVVTLLLAYVGIYQERMRAELRKLAAWPRTFAGQREPFVRETLVLARESLSVPRVMLVWDDEEEPWMWVAVLEGNELRFEREGPDFLELMIGPEVREATFVAGMGHGARALVNRDGRLSIHRSGAVIAPAAVERYAIRYALSTPVVGQTVNGRLFFLDRELEIHDGAVAEIIARLVATRLDQLNAAKKESMTAVAEERLRVARDLHDGLLQSLTGAALQLQMVHHLIPSDPEMARTRLRNVQDLIVEDQRELRSLISQLRPQNPTFRPSLQTRLLELADRFQRQWDLAVTMEIDPELSELRDGIASDISSLVTEAVANAAKHARAGRIDASVGRRAGVIEIVVTDDGNGFPFLGTYTLVELDEQRRGPVTLKERVASLNGDLHLTSTPTGSRVEVTLRLEEEFG
jgi:signal transduction histidine kinase